jgi:hypothetical protein
MQRVTDQNHLRPGDRTLAIRRGLEFLYRMACDAENFEAYGFDLVSCFYGIFSTATEGCLRARAHTVCLELARKWRETHPTLPAEIDADDLSQFVIATDAADRIGLPDLSLKTEIRRAAKRFRPEDYYWFDPRVEPPPLDVPEECECGVDNRRGANSCVTCGRPLTMMSRYEVWLVALIRTYFGDSYGVNLGARYVDALKWLPFMRPYKRAESEPDEDFYWSAYAITHVVYTLNDYGVYRLLPEWLPDEFDFLVTQLPAVIAEDDAETAGEMLDSLKALGLTSKDPCIRMGEAFVLSRQNPDGSWGDMEADDIYERYHPTLTAIDGLREHAWHSAELRSHHVTSLLNFTKPPGSATDQILTLYAS